MKNISNEAQKTSYERTKSDKLKISKKKKILENYLLVIFKREPRYLPTSVNIYNPDIKVIFKFISNERRQKKINLLEEGTIYKKAIIINNKINYTK